MFSTMDTDRVLQTYMSNGGYKNHGRCSQDILNAIKHYRGLQPRFEKFIFNDGTQKELVCLQGTIPVPYRGNNYNIPVSIWVLDTHPLHAPMCYVCPTPDMQVRVSRHVDYNGKVYLPYLHEWNEANADLLGLIQICIITFSEQPPVFAKSAAGPQQQQQQHPGYPPPNSNATATPPYPPYPPYQAQNQHQPLQQTQSSSISQEYIKASLVTAVEDKVRRSLREDFNTKQCELESLRKIRDDLQASQNATKASLASITSEIVRVGEMSDVLTRKKGELEEARDAIKDGQEEGNIDEVVQVVFPLYNQLLGAYAEDAAIDDAIYFLGEALRLGVIDLDNFLKSSRNISRKQFFLRLTALKCRGKAKLDGGIR